MNRLSLLLSSACVIAALAAPASSSAATTGTLTLSASGAPKKSKRAKRITSVRVIDVTTGAITAINSKSTRPALKLAPGGYLIALRTTDSDGRTSEGAGGLAVVKAGRKVKRRLRVKRLKAKKRARASVSSADEIYAPPSESEGRIVVGIDPNIVIRGVKGYPNGVPIDAVIAGPVSERCPGGEPAVDVVEIRRRGDILEELERANDPRFDASSVVRPGHLLKERQMVRGGGTVKDGKITIELKVVDLATGAVLAQSQVSGAAKQIFDLIEDAGSELMKDLCGARVDVTFTGSGTYDRHEGDASTDDQDDLHASYEWSVAYRGVKLGTDGALNFASAASASGSWTTNGRNGVAGPGSYSCGAPVIGYSGEFSIMTQRRVGAAWQLTISPFLNIQGDNSKVSCSGLPGPPYASFALWGSHPPNQAVVSVVAKDLDAGPREFAVGPKSVLAPDCSDVVGGFHSPCTQSGNWSGQVTVARSAD